MTENEISRVIIDAAFEVHSQLGGPGLIVSGKEGAICSARLEAISCGDE
jgi:hypothetical protein